MKSGDIPDDEMHQRVTHTMPSWAALPAALQAMIAPRSKGAREGWTQPLRHLAEYVSK